ncbi:MAG: helix-turn-helix domain-containing protein [Clostridiales bacterium]|nr:helix-turn-helix domain-containing protein [Clostridiales bacterium]
MIAFGNILTSARKAKGLTQEQLAEALSVSRQTVSHWENGRVQPSDEVMQQICGLLDIDPLTLSEQESPTDNSVSTAQKKSHLRLLIAFFCGVLITLAVVYGIMPLLNVPSEPVIDAAAVAATDPVINSNPADYSWDWYQQPAAVEVNKAYLTFTATNTPIKLIEVNNAPTPYRWDIIFGIEETNGVAFTITKMTEAFFQEDHSQMDHRVFMGSECVRFFDTYTFEANTKYEYNLGKSVKPIIGYGIALEGIDANGNDLAFGFYVPLSQEVVEQLTDEDFQLDSKLPQEGEAFLRITPDENPAYLIFDTEYDGDLAWRFSFSIANESGVDFMPSSMIIAFINNGVVIQQFQYNEDNIAQMYGSDTFSKGDDPFTPSIGTYKQDLTGIGCMMTGIDANGNELVFASYVTLISELR